MIDLNRVREAYDVLSDLVKNDLDTQFKQNRIKGTDYGTVYSNLMNTVLTLAMRAPTDDAQVCEIRARTENTARATAKADDDITIELLRVQMLAWAEAFKSGQLEDIPDILNDDEISKLYQTELDRLNNGNWRDNTNQCYSEDTTQGV